MIQLNTSNLGISKDKQGSSVKLLSSFILPLSGEKQATQKISVPVGAVLDFNLYQYCECCKTETSQARITERGVITAYCSKCKQGYKIGL